MMFMKGYFAILHGDLAIRKNGESGFAFKYLHLILESWVHISIKRRNSAGAPLYVHINGEQFRTDGEDAERECTVNSYTPTNNQVTEKNTQLVLGKCAVLPF